MILGILRPTAFEIRGLWKFNFLFFHTFMNYKNPFEIFKFKKEKDIWFRNLVS